MPVLPILFEDHLVPSFRPLSWTLPLFEMRCGLFNTRERLELTASRFAGGHGSQRPLGGLLARGMLCGLHTADRWISNPADLGALAKDGRERVLWLNGRLGARFDLLDLLLDDANSAADFAWFDGNGLLAANVAGDQSARLLESWLAWERKAAAAGAWTTAGVLPENWLAPDVVSSKESCDLGQGYTLWGGDPHLKTALAELIGGTRPVTLDWIWEVVPATPAAIAEDLAAWRRSNREEAGLRRTPFGIFADPANEHPVWSHPLQLQAGTVPAGVSVEDPSRFWTGPEVKLGSFVAVDTTSGPVILDRGVTVQPHVLLEGPLYVGPGSIIKAGARIYGDSSFGIGCRLAGEIAESTFGDFANKQHAGFIGHAVLGSWINLGAMTTCSDLKNNYGMIRVDLGHGAVDTGLRFVGLMMGDHAKTAIGTLFNTGTTVGVATNIFGAGMPPKLVGNFRWGGEAGCPAYAVEPAVATASVVMERRGCRLGDSHRELYRLLAG